MQSDVTAKSCRIKVMQWTVKLFTNQRYKAAMIELLKQTAETELICETTNGSKVMTA